MLLALLGGAGTTPEAVIILTNGRGSSFGDSFVNNASSKSGNAITTYSSGLLVQLESVSQGALLYDHDRNRGVNGETIADVNARIATDAAALAPNTDFWFYSAGRNSPFTDAAGDLQGIKDGCLALLALGKPVFVDEPCPPRGGIYALSTPQKAVAAATRAGLIAWIATQPNIRFVDYYSLWDSGDGTPNANDTYDSLHGARQGVNKAANKFWTDFGALFPARTLPSYTAYNSSSNQFGNLVHNKSANAANLAGVAGQVFNATGSYATDWQHGRDSGTSANGDIVLSKETVGDGTSRQVFTDVMTGTFNGSALSLTPNGSSPTTPAELDTKTISAEFTAEIVSNNGMFIPSTIVFTRNNSVSIQCVGMSHLDGMAANVFAAPTGTYLCKTPPVLVNGVGVTPTFWSQLRRSQASGVSTTWKATKPLIKRVT